MVAGKPISVRRVEPGVVIFQAQKGTTYDLQPLGPAPP